jgi:hypothetical protein
MLMRRLPVLLVVAAACSSGPRPARGPAPDAGRARPGAARTAPDITAADLTARLEAFAHDSMLGREAGTAGNVKATDFLAAELARNGVEPAGENGTYFQTVPLGVRSVDTTASVKVGSRALALGDDYLPIPSFGDAAPFGMSGSIDGVTTILGGRLGDSVPALPRQQWAGRLVLLLPPTGPGNPEAAIGRAATAYQGAAGVAFAVLDFIPKDNRGFLTEPREGLGLELPEGPLGALVTLEAAAALLGAAPDTVSLGHTGPPIAGTFGFITQPLAHPARNVIAIVRGSDPGLRGQYVALGAHNDHVGIAPPVDHDSVRAFNRVVRPAGAESPPRPPTPEESARIQALLDSLRAQRPPRPDSVFNGADDDGSGSVTLLEVAEALARAAVKPRRSVLFVWHTAEESGLYGAAHFTDHPTVPRDSIVAQINMDMVGRGTIHDLTDGGSGYLQVIGSRRLSTELGDLVESVNTRGRYGWRFDYTFDAAGHPDNYYCRSDHYMYARYGIPIVFFSTGSHPDYHQITDEPQYIAYDKLARFGRYVLDLTRALADLDHRPVVDQPKPNPKGQCRQ